MKSTLESILFIPDVHAPYEDTRAFNLMLAAARRFKPDHIVILGDFFDMYSVSSHSKNPNRAFSLKSEIDYSIDLLKKVVAINPSAKKVFLAGNHEDRLTRYLQDRAPELYNIINLPQILHLDKLGFKYISYKDHCTIGKLYITHDCGSSGKYAAFRCAEAFQRNIVSAHTHRLQYLIDGNAEGKRHVSTIFGWLGDINQVDYMHRIKAARDWSLGFGIGYLNQSTDFVYLIPTPILKYTCLIEGQLITG